MKILGLDIATQTGWSCIEDGNLVDYGIIQVDGRMELPQRLHYFHLELTRVLNRIQPDWCFIEDVILGISGAKTLAYLGRLNGVAINAAFTILQERVRLFTPTTWKANSVDGLGGMAKKWQIQLAIVRHFNIDITGDFDTIDQIVNDQKISDDGYKAKIQELRVSINKLKASTNRKRDPLTEEDIKSVNKTIKLLEQDVKEKKAEKKSSEKEFDKTMTKISIDISAQTGMTPDICDSCGVALCGIKSLQHED